MSKISSVGLFLCSALTGAATTATSFTEAIEQGQPILNARLRWEDASQSNLADSQAFTLRTAVGYATAPWTGFQAAVEVEDVTALSPQHNYNAAGTNPGGAGRTVIADPPGTGLNQAWISYTAPWFGLRIGRQRIVYDNARFVGDSGWRQNQQTFDAAQLTTAPTPSLALDYAYSWRVNRIYGDRSPQPDWTGDLHFLRASYSGWARGTFTTYGYLLNVDNAPAFASNTIGASFAGSTPIHRTFKLNYRVEYATQTEAGRNPVSYRADYRLVELGAVFPTWELTGAWEVLGSDHGQKGFATPLSTLHAFNGWADLFANTPVRGLRDASVSATTKLPGGFPGKIAYHEFRSAYGRDDYGREWDAQVSHKFGPHVTGLVKWARYDGRPPFFDTERWWFQCEFSL